MQLRYYQEEAIQAILDYGNNNEGNPLVDIATGGGKSLIMADLTRRFIEDWQGMRVMSLTHVAELIKQNYEEFLGVMPFADAGIFSAGLGQRRANSQVIFAGIQTVYNKAFQIGHIDVIEIDEAHLVPPNAATQYGRFIKDMKSINPDLRIVGFTATPYRLDSGLIIDGEDALFDEIVYTYGIAQGVRDGYLTGLSTKATEFEYDVTGVGKLGGDFKRNVLQAAVDGADKNRVVVDEIVAKGRDKRSWLMFCSGVEHALHIRDEIRSRGIDCETVTGDTPKGERRDILEALKNYELRSVTNNSVLTTGTNIKGVDLIGGLRPTLSPSLYSQMMGRGTRVIYAANMPLDTAEERIAAIAAGPKPTCLVLDFAKLVDKHGPVDMINPKAPGKGTGEAPFKICPQDMGGCGEKLHTTVRECDKCGHEFEFDDQPKIETRSADAPIMSIAEPEWRKVSFRTFRYHEGKGDKPPTVKVTYMMGVKPVNEWVCPEHKGFPKSKADKLWSKHGGLLPFPVTVLEWLDRQNELKETEEVQIQPSGRYWVPVDHKVGGMLDNVAEAANDNEISYDMDDEIPF